MSNQKIKLTHEKDIQPRMPDKNTTPQIPPEALSIVKSIAQDAYSRQEINTAEDFVNKVGVILADQEFVKSLGLHTSKELEEAIKLTTALLKEVHSQELEEAKGIGGTHKWVVPDRWPEKAEEKHWRDVQSKLPLTYELIFNAATMFAGPRWNRRTYRLSEVEYLEEIPSTETTSPAKKDNVDGCEVEIKLDRSTLPKDGSFVEFKTENDGWMIGYFTEGDEEYVFTKGTEDVGEPFFAWNSVIAWKYK